MLCACAPGHSGQGRGHLWERRRLLLDPWFDRELRSCLTKSLVIYQPATIYAITAYESDRWVVTDPTQRPCYETSCCLVRPTVWIDLLRCQCSLSSAAYMAGKYDRKHDIVCTRKQGCGTHYGAPRSTGAAQWLFTGGLSAAAGHASITNIGQRRLDSTIVPPKPHALSSPRSI